MMTDAPVEPTVEDVPAPPAATETETEATPTWFRFTTEDGTYEGQDVDAIMEAHPDAVITVQFTPDEAGNLVPDYYEPPVETTTTSTTTSTTTAAP